MTYVAINLLTVPAEAGETLEQRFAARKGSVDTAPGFLSFELLRPLTGTSDYLVLTRWRSQSDFEDWTSSQSFRHGHAEASGRESQRQPAATGSTIWSFEVAQESWAPLPTD
jgi:heme-degrading monooxygenase HmoA